jgi:mono/diheme cytochrome c family protein
MIHDRTVSRKSRTMDSGNLRLCLLACAMGPVLVALHAGEPASAPPPPDAPALFKKHCAPCHGGDGKAGTPMAKRLGVKDLTATVLSAEQITAAIADGRKTPRGGMPAFKDKLTEEERQALAAFVRSLQALPPAQ